MTGRKLWVYLNFCEDLKKAMFMEKVINIKSFIPGMLQNEKPCIYHYSSQGEYYIWLKRK